MNCFNIRELQSLLRNRFFDELLPINVLNTSASSSKNALFNLNFLTNRGGNVESVSPSTHLNLSYFSSSSFFNFSQTSVNPVKDSRFALLVSRGHSSSLVSTALTLFTVKLNLLASTIFNFLSSVVFFFNSSVFKTTLPSLSGLITASPNIYYIVNSVPFYSLTSSKANAPFINPNTDLIGTRPGLSNFYNNSSFLEQFGFLESFNVNIRNLSIDSPSIVYKIKIGNYLPDDFYFNNFNFLQTTFNFKNMFSSSPD